MTDEIELNSGEKMPIRAHDPEVFGRGDIVEETKTRQEAVDKQEAQKRHEQQQETIEIKKVVEPEITQPQILAQMPEPEKVLEKLEVISKFVKFCEELEREVKQKMSDFRVQDVRYLQGHIGDLEFEEVSTIRTKYRDDKVKEVIGYAKSIGLIAEKPDTNPNIKGDPHVDTNPQIASFPHIETEPHVATVMKYLNSSLVPFAEIELPLLIKLFRQFFEIRLSSLEHATQDVKKDAYTKATERIPESTGLTPIEIAGLERQALSLLYPEEPKQDTTISDDTLPRGVPKSALLHSLEYLPPPATPARGTETQPPILTHGQETPPAPPAPPATEEHIPLQFEKNQADYEQKVYDLLNRVTDFESTVVIYLKHKDDLSEAKRKYMRDGLLEYSAKLLELDDSAVDINQSMDRLELMRLLTQIRREIDTEVLDPQREIDNQQAAQIEKDSKSNPPADGVSIIDDVRTMHDRVRATYASVQHSLTIDQRRSLREQISKFASLVRRAELDHHIAHATEHAPLIAHGVLASKRT